MHKMKMTLLYKHTYPHIEQDVNPRFQRERAGEILWQISRPTRHTIVNEIHVFRNQKQEKEKAMHAIMPLPGGRFIMPLLKVSIMKYAYSSSSGIHFPFLRGPLYVAEPGDGWTLDLIRICAEEERDEFSITGNSGAPV